jgi:AraC family L-rhamnose operon transcriptional activator RhaR
MSVIRVEECDVAGQLILRKDEFLPPRSGGGGGRSLSAKRLRRTHPRVLRAGAGVARQRLHVLNDRPWRITRGDLFYIRAEDKHSYASVNDLVLQNVIYCPDGCGLTLTGAHSRLLDAKGSRTGA